MKVAQSVLIVALILAVSFVCYVLLASPPEPIARQARPELAVDCELIEVRREDVPRSLQVLGDLSPWRTTTVRSEIHGVVSELHAPRVGRGVPAQALLLHLQRADQEGQLQEAAAAERAAEATWRRSQVTFQQARQEVELAEERLQLAAADVPRMETLFEDGLVTERDLDNSRMRKVELRSALAALERQLRTVELEVGVSKAQHEHAVASHHLARLQLAKTSIHAPYAAVITRRHVEVGDHVVPGAPLFEVQDLSALQVRVAVPAEQIRHLEFGAKAEVFIADIGRTFPGEVDEITPRAEVTTRTFDVRIRMESDQGHPLPGHFARVTLELLPAPDAIVVPARAIAYRDGREWVFCEREGSRVELVEVRVTEVLADQALIEGPLQPGDRVAWTNVDLLFDGALVRPPRDGAAATTPSASLGTSPVAGSARR